jgi:hypothetical protein
VSGGASYPIERVDDHSLGKRILGSDAKVYFRDGLRRGVDSFSARVNRDQFKSDRQNVLTERVASLVGRSALAA